MQNHSSGVVVFCFFFALEKIMFHADGVSDVHRGETADNRNKQTSEPKRKKKTFSLLIHWDMIPFLIKAPRLPFSFFLFWLVQVSAVMMNEYA